MERRTIMAEPVFYRYQYLMDDLNRLMMAVKVHHHLPDCPKEAAKLKLSYPIPSVEELDQMLAQINRVLMQEKEQMRKY